MTWRSDLITSMSHDETRTLLAMIAGGQPEAFDWAASGMTGTFAERFAQARQGEAETPRCGQCGGLIDPYTDPYDGKTPRWRHLALPGGAGRDVARFLDEEHGAEPASAVPRLVGEPYRTPQDGEDAGGAR